MVTVTCVSNSRMQVIRAFGQQAGELEDFREVNQDYKIYSHWYLVLVGESLEGQLLLINLTLVCLSFEDG